MGYIIQRQGGQNEQGVAGLGRDEVREAVNDGFSQEVLLGDLFQRLALDGCGIQSRVEHGVVQGGLEHIALHFVFVFEITLFLALFNLEQRRLGDIHMPTLDELGHLTVEEGEEQGADVRTVHVRVGHDDDAVVA